MVPVRALTRPFSISLIFPWGIALLKKVNRTSLYNLSEILLILTYSISFITNMAILVPGRGLTRPFSINLIFPWGITLLKKVDRTSLYNFF